MKTSIKGTILGGRVYTPLVQGDWLDIPNGAIAIDAAGKIEAMGHNAEIVQQFPKRQRIDMPDKLILPGLIDCHQHVCHYDWCTMIPDLMTWLKVIYSLELRFQEDAYAAFTAERFFADLISTGTTTVCAHGPYFYNATDIAFTLAKTSGMRVIMGMNTGDQNLPDPLSRPAKQNISDSIRLWKHWNRTENDRLRYCFTVRPAYCASADLMEGMAWAAKEFDGRVQNHLSEDEEGLSSMLKLFPGKQSDTEIYLEMGLLTPKTVLAHGVYLENKDPQLLAESGAAIAHCPRANLLAGGKQCDLGLFSDYQIPCGLGSDLGGGKGMSMFNVMEDALKVSPQLSIHELFNLATLGGAKALGLQKTIGSIEQGKEADLIVVSPTMPAQLTPLNEPEEIEDLLAALVFRGDDRNVNQVIVGGTQISGKPLQT